MAADVFCTASTGGTSSCSSSSDDDDVGNIAAFDASTIPMYSMYKSSIRSCSVVQSAYKFHPTSCLTFSLS
jgi:hypothetical protein